MRYIDLIQQTFDFPTDEFTVQNDQLSFHGVSLTEIIETYGTPLRLTYLPKISNNIKLITTHFQEVLKKYNYEGTYTYCYCTKSSHFKFIIEEALEAGVQIETSSAYDISIIRNLHQKGLIDKEKLLICNGFKRPLYLQQIVELIKDGFLHCIPVLDNLKEGEYYQSQLDEPYDVGIRLASDEEPQFEFYTSRLGIRSGDVIDYYHQKIKPGKARLKLLHHFINTGIRDSAYYWSELSRFMHKYCELKKVCPELDTIDIGGGFPIKTSLNFEYDYRYMIEQVVENIQWICRKNHVQTPHIITEFGSFTVGESGAMLYSILDQKLQNDKELWYMIDGSFINHLPDIWGSGSKFILLPINEWKSEYQKVNLGGLTCDSMDYYNSEIDSSEVFLPVKENGKPLHIGMFHTGAYQESLGGFGGIQHCLIPAPKHVIVYRDQQGKIETRLFSEEQKSEDMLRLLGYS
jgi:arginine decarboxylase